jgi:type III restriction enzyme
VLFAPKITAGERPVSGCRMWKEFLLEEDFDFQYVVGFSGTCYLENDYFADVVVRRQTK